MRAKTTKKKLQYHIERPPVVAVMGHVDHGKTSILDKIRETNVQAKEAGGITQNTRAHSVAFQGQKITFIDTPGHEAFSQMRSRGAKVTDIVLLVVAADDGVQPQTIESIRFAQEAKCPIIVAINKIDLPGVDAKKILNQLSQYNVLVEAYGGDVQVYEVSAHSGKGITELLEGILLQAEMMQIKTHNSLYGKAQAVVLESRLDNKLGPIALILVKAGIVEVGNYLVNTEEVSCVRALLDEFEKPSETVVESTPIWLVGVENIIPVGREIYFVESEKEGKNIMDSLRKDRQSKILVKDNEESELRPEGEATDLSLLSELMENEERNKEVKKLNLVVKADVQGTLEVILNELTKLNNEETEVKIIHSGTGAITRNDVLKAKNTRGLVIGFQVGIPTDLESIIRNERVIVRTYKVIYELINEIKDAMEGMLEPEEYEEEVARAKVKKIFPLSDGDLVAGCVVLSGNMIKGYQVWVERDGEEIGRGKITSLRKAKNEVKEAQKNTECGILIHPKVEIEEGDEIVQFKVIKN